MEIGVIDFLVRVLSVLPNKLCMLSFACWDKYMAMTPEIIFLKIIQLKWLQFIDWLRNNASDIFIL